MPDTTAPSPAVPPQEESPSPAAILPIVLVPEARGLRHWLAVAFCRIRYRIKRIRRKILRTPGAGSTGRYLGSAPAADPRSQPEASGLTIEPYHGVPKVWMPPLEVRTR